LKSISENLIGLSFSRDAEEDADRLSVKYLCRENAKYKPNGAAGFFNKLMQKDDNNNRMVEFLSTHPNPPNRVQKIDALVKQSGCTTNLSTDSSSYKEFKNSLP
jgi:predicted Zn-dependent protease